MPQTKAGAARNPWLQYLQSVSQDYRDTVAGKREVWRQIKPYIPQKLKRLAPAPVPVAAAVADTPEEPHASLQAKRLRRARAAVAREPACQQGTLLRFAANAAND
jgi:hypothetical protein